MTTLAPRASWASPLVWRGEIRLSGCRAHSDRPHAGASLGRGSVAQGRVQALPIVKHLDVLEHRGPRLRAGAEPGLMNALRLERGEEALHGRIVQAIAASAHRGLDAMSLQHRPIRPSGVLHAAVAMMNEPPRRLAALESHDQGVDAESRLEMLRHRPAHDLARGQILDGRQVQKALIGW